MNKILFSKKSILLMLITAINMQTNIISTPFPEQNGNNYAVLLSERRREDLTSPNHDPFFPGILELFISRYEEQQPQYTINRQNFFAVTMANHFSQSLRE